MKIKNIVIIWLVSLILASCVLPNALSTMKIPTPTTTPIQGLQAVNGTHLYYEIIGKGAPLFVLHGSGGSDRYFLPYMEALSDKYQLFFYDQRGTGLSDGNLD